MKSSWEEWTKLRKTSLEKLNFNRKILSSTKISTTDWQTFPRTSLQSKTYGLKKIIRPIQEVLTQIIGRITRPVTWDPTVRAFNEKVLK